MLHDAHCHMDYMANGEEVAADALRADCLLFANTVTPAGYEAALARFGAFPNVTIGWGMHPWHVGSPDEALASLEKHDPRFIGEIGLDFGPAHENARDKQLAAFQTIASWCARRGGKVLSLHSVHAAREVIDILEQTGALGSCTTVFHWYSGPSDQLKRAKDAGCLFSVGPRMTATIRGREYVKAIPARQMLLETDAPPHEGEAYSFKEQLAGLHQALEAIQAAKGPNALQVMSETYESLF